MLLTEHGSEAMTCRTLPLFIPFMIFFRRSTGRGQRKRVASSFSSWPIIVLSSPLRFGYGAQNLHPVARKIAQHLPQVHGVFLSQAQQQPPLGGDAHAVAVAAKIVAVRRNEADAGIGARDPVVTGRPPGLFGGWGQGEPPREIAPDLIA